MLYNPVVRNFCRIRRVLIETLGLPRHVVRPTSTFAELIPREQRPRVWDKFRRDCINVDPLGFSDDQFMVIILAMITCLAVGRFLWYGSTVATILSPIIVGILVAYVLRYRAAEIDRRCTVGEVVLAMTTMSQCREAGYRLTRNEVLFKVRRVLAESSGIDAAEITPEKSFRDLGLE